MSVPLLLSLVVALLAAGSAFFAGRIVLTSAERYRQTFQDAASHNLADMFLFFEHASCSSSI